MQQLEHVRFPEEAGISSKGILNYIAAREEAGLEHHAIRVLRHANISGFTISGVNKKPSPVS